MISLWGASDEVSFNNYSQATEFADVPERMPHLPFDDVLTPYSTIPMPPLFTDEKPFSDWPNEFSKKVYRIPRPIDADILKNMSLKGSVGYTPNPKTRQRNECVYDLNYDPSELEDADIESGITKVEEPSVVEVAAEEDSQQTAKIEQKEISNTTEINVTPEIGTE
jgi:PAB-dependent poly(A)-specific ribonuclease subunit 2